LLLDSWLLLFFSAYILLSKMIKLTNSNILSSVKMETHLKSCTGSGTFEIRYGIAESTSKTAADTMEKTQSPRAL
jgi:hypothetical protein